MDKFKKIIIDKKDKYVNVYLYHTYKYKVKITNDKEMYKNVLKLSNITTIILNNPNLKKMLDELIDIISGSNASDKYRYVFGLYQYNEREYVYCQQYALPEYLYSPSIKLHNKYNPTFIKLTQLDNVVKYFRSDIVKIEEIIYEFLNIVNAENETDVLGFGRKRRTKSPSKKTISKKTISKKTVSKKLNDDLNKIIDDNNDDYLKIDTTNNNVYEDRYYQNPLLFLEQ